MGKNIKFKKYQTPPKNELENNGRTSNKKDHCLNSKEEFRQPGELVAELPGADNRAGRRQQQGRQHRQQQQQQLLQQHENVEGTSGGGDSAGGGGGPSQNTRSRAVTSRNPESSTQSTGYTISTRSRTRREEGSDAV